MMGLPNGKKCFAFNAVKSFKNQFKISQKSSLGDFFCLLMSSFYFYDENFIIFLA